ncbi:MAG: aspartate dehydrogenase [Caldimonas sp.]
MNSESRRQEQRVGIAGLGTIGRALGKALNDGIPGMRLAAVSARNLAGAERWVATQPRAVPIVPLHALAEHSDIVVECAPSALLPEIALPVLRGGKQLVVLSVGALLQHPELIELAKTHGGQILVPTGALIGLDALTAAAEGEIKSVTMVTRKPVEGLLGAPYLVEKNIDIAGITAPLLIFSGSAREAAIGFPANLNVAVALSLAGIGPDRTTLEIWADPTIKRNTHTISVDSDSASFTMTMQNIPTENPKTGRITALSVVSLLRKMSAPLRVGT